MSAATLKKIWKNEYFQTAIMVIMINALVFGFWYGVKMVLNTEYPALAVASTSMLPTLNVGDLIIVKGVPPDQINASYITGDIIVFRNPYNPDELIVHRAIYVERKDTSYGTIYYFTTHGDNNPTFSNEGPFSDSYLVGKVVGRIPNVGNFSLLVHTERNMYFFTILVIIIIVAILTFLPETERKDKIVEEKQMQKKSKLFGKLDFQTVYLLILNLLLISFMIFNTWGAFTFWQPGAKPAQDVTIRGMYPDVQFHESFTQTYNNISEVSISQSIFAYNVNCFASDGVRQGMRPGVSTFSWTQTFLLSLLILDGWVLINFAKSRSSKKENTRVSSEKLESLENK